MLLDNKVALITGSSGIGEAAAKLLASAGARVGVLGHTEEEVDATVASILEQGGKAVPLVADVADAEAMQLATDRLVQTYGRLDIVFANAGINGVWASLETLTPEDWDKTLNVNLRGTFLTVKYAVPYLKKQGGSVIITASVNGTRMFSNTGATAYASSKAAQVAFAKMTALELAKHRIRVNVICPGAIGTEIDDNTERKHLDDIREPANFPDGDIPLTDGQPGTAEQVAQLVLFLASDLSSHITGTEIWIDGAQSLLRG
ncbi:MAG: SDR family oxidoreductase [Anaerolineae bacterium]|nr:SDR family oxidoreductase [Anaerolineae bacterium]